MHPSVRAPPRVIRCNANVTHDKRENEDMDSFSAYQSNATRTAVYPGSGDVTSSEGLSYATLGLVGEAGEIANKVKKIIRDNDGVITDMAREDIAAELGDVLWYVSALATQLGATLGGVAAQNLSKLRSRQERGKLSGSGDNR